MKERWKEMLEYQQKVQTMTDLERADWAKELLLSWMQTRPGGVHQSSIAATEFHRLVRMLAFNVQEAVTAARREGAEEMRECAAMLAEMGCLVPPDGGSPTESEREMCDRIAAAIRALKENPA